MARRAQAAVAPPAPGRKAAPAAAEAAQSSGARVLAAVLPYLTVVIAAFAPLAAAVYLVTSTGWGVAERWVFGRARLKDRAG